MPQVTVYIREQDLERWKALEKKSEFIHNALNPDKVFIVDKTKMSIRPLNIQENKDSSKPAVVKNKPLKSDVCKQHGIDKNLCRMMKHS